jgi:hypothetical protein
MHGDTATIVEHRNKENKENNHFALYKRAESLS